jgi:hypothetical protein
MIKLPPKPLALGITCLVLLAASLVPLPRYQSLAHCKPGDDCSAEGWYWGDSVFRSLIDRPSSSSPSTSTTHQTALPPPGPTQQPSPPPTQPPSPAPLPSPPPPPSQAYSFDRVGTLQYVDCTNGGQGCFEYRLRISGQEIYALSGITDPDRYLGQVVRIRGDWREAGPAGWVEVKLIGLAN